MGWFWFSRKKTLLPAAQSCHSDSQSVSYAHALSDWPSSLAISLALHWFCQLHSGKFPAFAFLLYTDVTGFCLCVSSAAVLQWPEEENLQRRGLRQVVQQAVLPGGHWDLYGEWLMQAPLSHYRLRSFGARSKKRIVLLSSNWLREYYSKAQLTSFRSILWSKQPSVLHIYLYELVYIFKSLSIEKPMFFLQLNTATYCYF